MEAEETQEKSALAGRRRRFFLRPLHERAGRNVPGAVGRTIRGSVSGMRVKPTSGELQADAYADGGLEWQRSVSNEFRNLDQVAVRIT
jgi:hypothetical protein